MVEMCVCLLIQCQVGLQAPSVNRTLFQWVWDLLIDSDQNLKMEH